MDLRYLSYRDLSKWGVVCNQSDCSNPVAGAWAPTLLGFLAAVGGGGGAGGGAPRGQGGSCSVSLVLGFNETLHRQYGTPARVTAEHTIDPARAGVNVSLTWYNKTATRLQEAMTVFNQPAARAGHRWGLDVLGE